MLLVMAMVQLAEHASADPSFDCSSNQLTSDELAVCGNSILASYDRDMAALWKTLSKSQRSELRASQKQWLLRRAQCNFDVSCIEAFYLVRLAELRRILGIVGETPDKPTPLPQPEQQPQSGQEDACIRFPGLC